MIKRLKRFIKDYKLDVEYNAGYCKVNETGNMFFDRTIIGIVISDIFWYFPKGLFNQLICKIFGHKWINHTLFNPDGATEYFECERCHINYKHNWF